MKTCRPNRERALHTFMREKAEIDAFLVELAAMSANYFGADPQAIHYGHVGDLGRIKQLLKRAIDPDA